MMMRKTTIFSYYSITIHYHKAHQLSNDNNPRGKYYKSKLAQRKISKNYYHKQLFMLSSKCWHRTSHGFHRRVIKNWNYLHKHFGRLHLSVLHQTTKKIQLRVIFNFLDGGKLTLGLHKVLSVCGKGKEEGRRKRFQLSLPT